MDDRNDLDRLLETGLPAPESEVVDGVTPWKQATNRVLLGFALTTVTLNFLGLNYLLPAVGWALQYLGLRTLRRENKGFFASWILSAALGLLFFAGLIANATIWHAAIDRVTALPLWRDAALGLGFVRILCLRSGYAAVQDKAGCERHTRQFGFLMLWYGVVTALILMDYAGLILGLAIVAAYFFILRSLYRLSSALDEAGWSVEAAPVRLSDGKAALLIALVTAIGLACGYGFFHSYPMEFSPREARSAEAQAVATRLAALGFPEDVLADLTDEDILACRGAERVVVQRDDTLRENSPTGSLFFTGVAVELPGERETWRLFHYFSWDDPARFYGTEAIALRSDFDDKYWTHSEGTTGRVLYDRDGVACVAPYHSLESESYTYNSVFFGTSAQRGPIAAFSLPNGATRYRCYLAHEMRAATTDDALLSSWVEYVHQTSWLQYPVRTAKEYKMAGMYGGNTFAMMQTAIQFFPDEDLPDRLTGAHFSVVTSP